VNVIGFLAWLVVAAVVLLIVDRLNVGLKVGGFLNAVIAAAVIAVVAFLLEWVLGLIGITLGGGLVGAILALIASAVVLMVAGRILRGMSVSGFGGAILSAIAIAVVGWLVLWVLSIFGL
jgi:putative membrane protein